MSESFPLEALIAAGAALWDYDPNARVLALRQPAGGEATRIELVTLAQRVAPEARARFVEAFALARGHARVLVTLDMSVDGRASSVLLSGAWDAAGAFACGIAAPLPDEGRAMRGGDIAQSLARLAFAADLVHALKTGAVEPYFQPVIRLADGAVAGFEALARFRHPEQGLLAPAQFLPIAQELGLMASLGARMIEASSDKLAQWRARGRDVFVSVNVSGRELDEASVLELGAISAAKHAAGALRFEITEGQTLANLDRSAAALSQLKRAGLGVMLDDVGAGFASLDWLARLPADVLKIDRAFVCAMDVNPAAEKIVRALCALGRELGLAIVAEGVETADAAMRLALMGCDYAQGWYYAPALAPADADAFLARAA